MCTRWWSVPVPLFFKFYLMHPKHLIRCMYLCVCVWFLNSICSYIFWGECYWASLGRVEMQSQVVLPGLILSWAKLFQQESTALQHHWRGYFIDILPFVSSQSNPTPYFHVYLPLSSHCDSKINLGPFMLDYPSPRCHRFLLHTFSSLDPQYQTDISSLSILLFFSLKTCSFPALHVLLLLPY